ncbi:molybdenum ABC transporter ATP-binding protein [Bosea sp. Root381]|uniref:molybdenum ABC transporter ATP-binding protein n=1 Tax=Bosea sp. Root381 TaxID=1736524 RepID=UPI0006FD2872|nr:molybdenum ABC transporter ATP-binding protein [Bosea sp. Root381]KRE05971.1 molybdenum ABC transporter ATP-binding protein [Bosea sp. Root381]
MSPVLDIAVRHRLGSFQLNAELRSDGRLTALFGASGSGKTSLVNVIGGLVRPQAGHVRLDGEALVDTERGIFLPKHRRRIGYVFQEARLFPHLSVRQNLLFGHWFSKASDSNGVELSAVLELLGIGHLLARRPGALSGGEKQRVAIGRALLANPRLLLMDEPLSSLDEARKTEILPFIERLRDESRIPIVYVSHSITEVARLATTVALMDGGTVKNCGPTSEILSRLDLAALPGAPESSSLIEAEVVSFDREFGLTRLETRAGPLLVGRGDFEPGRKLRIRILASDVLVSIGPLSGISALNQLQGKVTEIGAIPESGTSAVDLRIDCGGEMLTARLTRKSVAALGLAVGSPVHAVVKSVSVETP